MLVRPFQMLDRSTPSQPFLFRDILNPSFGDRATLRLGDTSHPVSCDLGRACSALSTHMDKDFHAFLAAPFGRSCF